MKNINRRELLRTSASALLAANLWPGALAAQDKKPGESFAFLVVNDTHYLDNRCGPWLEKAIKQMKDQPEQPAFCLMLGDLSEDGKETQIDPLFQIFKGLGKKVHYVIGNHDYVTRTDWTPYKKLVTDALNYQFEHGGWQFVGLDTTQGQDTQNTKINEATLKWLDANLPKLDKEKPLVVFTHFPLAPFVPGRPVNSKDLLERLKGYNLQACYSGHFHAFTELQVQGAPFTTNRCCSHSRGNHDSDKKKGYFLCQAKDGKITRTFIQADLG
jgi:predicted phosphodiesterase